MKDSSVLVSTNASVSTDSEMGKINCKMIYIKDQDQ